jgi:hypothetical protein
VSRWSSKCGQVFSPGGAGSFDECGVERPFVLPLPTNKGGGYVMYYEATDSAGVRSIGAAQSQDGLSWERVGDKPVLAPSQVRSLHVWATVAWRWRRGSVSPGVRSNNLVDAAT